MRHPALLGCALLLSSCTSGMTPTLPDPNADVGLGEVGLLVWTTRSHQGLLGHASVPGSLKIDAHRKVVDGTPHLTPTDQHLVVVSARTLDAVGEAGAVGMTANAKLSQATHVAYDVRVSGYLELFPEDSKYVPGCGCCQGGGVAESCGDRYVTRLIRGSGKVQHLQQLAARAGIEASELVRAHGGTTYRRLNETEFKDAYFAYQLEPLTSLCSRLAPEDEHELLAVKAPSNCWAQAHLEDGNREARAWRVPDEVLCRKLANHHCSKQPKLAACTASFAAEGQAAPLSLTEPEPAAPGTATAAPPAAAPAAGVPGASP